MGVVSDSECALAYQFYKNVLKIRSEHFLEEISTVSLHTSYEKGAFYIQTGDEERYISFLESGIMACIDGDEQGRRRTKELYSTIGLPLFTKSKLSGITPAELSLQWLTAGSLFSFPLRELDRINARFPFEVLLLKVRLLEWAVDVHVEYRYLTGDLNPEQRYLWMKKHHPDYFERVPHAFIAEVMNITPETLSRIRRRVGDIP